MRETTSELAPGADDIINLSGLILQNDPTDISMIAASGNIIYAGLTKTRSDGVTYAGLEVAGPGTLEITAGGNIYQGSSASIDTSIGSGSEGGGLFSISW